MAPNDEEYDGRVILQGAMDVLKNYFEGQSDAYWGHDRAVGNKDRFPSQRLYSAYTHGYDTYVNPPKPADDYDGQ